jgi:hypothetical protein
VRPTFGRAYIEAEFEQIAATLENPLTVYLIGGGAMSLRDLKTATKDIDLVVTSGHAYGQLWAVLVELGYTEIDALAADYETLGATSCVENADGCRLDLFNQQVANKLVLTDGMIDRSEPVLETETLTVRLVSNEDIFLFKLVAGRDDDVEDLNVFVQAGVDYDTVSAELDTQVDRLNDDQFVTYANEALIELEERYGVTTPIEDHIREMTRQYYRGLELLYELDGPTTVDNLAAQTDLDAAELTDRLDYLEAFDRVIRDGETVRPRE